MELRGLLLFNVDQQLGVNITLRRLPLFHGHQLLAVNNNVTPIGKSYFSISQKISEFLFTTVVDR